MLGWMLFSTSKSPKTWKIFNSMTFWGDRYFSFGGKRTSIYCQRALIRNFVVNKVQKLKCKKFFMSLNVIFVDSSSQLERLNLIFMKISTSERSNPWTLYWRLSVISIKVFSNSFFFNTLLLGLDWVWHWLIF